MKINIRNIHEQPLNLTERVSSNFIDGKMKQYYPNGFTVKALVYKFANDIKMDVQLLGVARYDCGSCLDTYEKQFEFSLKQLFQIGSGKLSDVEDVIELDNSDTELNLAPFLREMVLLNHPFKMRCSDKCKGLCPGCGANLNRKQCRCGDKPVDPRWAELNKLIK
jgi:uncharacterized protein